MNLSSYLGKAPNGSLKIPVQDQNQDLKLDWDWDRTAWTRTATGADDTEQDQVSTPGINLKDKRCKNLVS